MGTQIKQWVTETLLQENIKREIVVYSGRFQPFHKGHYATYTHLVNKFGKSNVFIGTSNKVEAPKSPFNFRDKKEIMTKMFGIPSSQIVEIKNPYAPKEIIGNYDENTTAFITVVGEKDADRLGGKYFKPYNKSDINLPYKDAGYVYAAPAQPNPISGTDVRKGMSVANDSQRKAYFKKIYPKFDPKIYNLISTKIGQMREQMESFFQQIDINKLLSEVSSIPPTGKGIVDDGPGAFQGNMKSYKKKSESHAEQIGWEIVSYLMDIDDDSSVFANWDSTEYPNGSGQYPVSFFPLGKSGIKALAPRYGKQLAGTKAYNKWVKHIKKVCATLGWEFTKRFLQPIDIQQLTPQDKDKSPKQELTEGTLLIEGGAYGHMAHPFDTEINLTFGDLKSIIKGALNGELELTREKTDGQALAVSWRDDMGLIAARNKSHLKNKGEGALTAKGVSDKFAGRGGLTDAYNFAMRDLESAIKGLSKAQRDKIFKGGSKFMNLEVIWPTSVNVIPYGQPLLVFHNTIEYDEAGEAIGSEQSDAKVLAGMIKQINKDVTDKYTIQGPPVTELPKNQKLKDLQPKYLSQLSKLQGEFKLKDSDGVAEYHQAWWENYIDKNSPAKLTDSQKVGLTKRWAFGDKSFRLDGKNITDSNVLSWATGIEKQSKDKIVKDNLMKFENIFLGVGADVLSFMSSVLTANPDMAVRSMKKELDKTIKDVRQSGDPKKIEKLKLELKRLQSIGGPDKIVPNEGIVFVYKGHTMKLTGAFASLNQILGLMYF